MKTNYCVYVVPNMDSTTVQQAYDAQTKRGYFTRNLWDICDIVQRKTSLSREVRCPAFV